MIQEKMRCVITHDITVGESLAFKEGEMVRVESVSPNPQRPNNKYVVLSTKMGTRYQLADPDLRIATEQPEPKPATQGAAHKKEPSPGKSCDGESPGRGIDVYGCLGAVALLVTVLFLVGLLVIFCHGLIFHGDETEARMHVIDFTEDLVGYDFRSGGLEVKANGNEYTVWGKITKDHDGRNFKLRAVIEKRPEEDTWAILSLSLDGVTIYPPWEVEEY